MFEYIKGNYEEQASDYIVVDHQGMGYRINVSANTMSELPKLHKEVKVYIHPAFKEDDVTLYGFSSKEEREIFRTIITISGIGPKAAMGLLSQFTRDELIRYIVNEDAKASELVEKIIQPGMSIEDILKNALMSANPLGR